VPARAAAAREPELVVRGKVGSGLDDKTTRALLPRPLTTRSVPARVARIGDPMAPLLAARVDFGAAVARLEVRVARG
jgi:hypothetical protein